MNASIQGIIDHMFKDTVDNAETRALHEELLNNCLEHYDDLISRGMSETEAIDAVVDSLKGMKEVIDEYPKKNRKEDEEPEPAKAEKVPELRVPEPPKAEPVREKPAEYVYNPAEIRKLRTDLKNCDLKIGPSADGRIHVHCEDMDQLLCSLDGTTLSVRIVDQARKSIDEAGEKLRGNEFSLNGLLSFIGKAIGSVASSITVSWNVYVDMPAVQLSEMNLNAKSGDVEIKAQLPERLTVRTMSGDIEVEADSGIPAETVNIGAMSGEIEFAGNAAQIICSSMSGDVTARGRFTSAELKSTSGDVELNGEAETLRMNSVSGDITGEIRSAEIRSIEARSTSGDVEIDLAPGTDSVHASVSTVSGSASNRIPDGGAGALLKIQAASVSGDVRIR